MPRPRRLELPAVPLHVVQRGNNRNVCFFGDVDRRFYLKCLAEAAARRDVAVNAYVLMGNHTHLLITPRDSGSVAAMLQDLGRRYVRVINTIHGRTGTLWEGRYKSSPVLTERYLLLCHRYIELNPVRAGLVLDPSHYTWSSYSHYAHGRVDPIVTPHDAYEAMGESDGQRREAFKALCAEPTDPAALKMIRESINASRTLGAEIPKRGRPKQVDPEIEGHAESGNLF